jgi:hypothetical protein
MKHKSNPLGSVLVRALQTPDDLDRWVRLFCNLRIPRRAVCKHHSAPFDYLARAYFEPSRDQVVHAPRGGGKTRIAALATLLDLLHKPQVAVRILGGSMEQSLRMWEHLVPDLQRLQGEQLKKSAGNSRRIKLASGATCAVLTQSERAVRGLRVQKLRCDEVELFKPEIWSAAQLVTRSQHGVVGAIDALSTLHEPFGLMQQILDDARSRATPVVQWCILDVLERCAPDRDCKSCPLWDDCQGIAKTACEGFVKIDDAIAMKQRVSLQVWQSEMLCQRPSVRGAVFHTFDPATHVRAFDTPSGSWSLAIDFGFAAPLVCLWICTSEQGTFVVDEYVQPQRTVQEHLDEIASRPWPRASYIACDPAGNGRNEQTGASSVSLLKRAGHVVRSRPSRILEGIEFIRAALRPAAGPVTLFIHPRCKHLIRALQSYRYSNGPVVQSELPLKDGEHDHLIDALRYHFVNRPRPGPTVRKY